MEILGLTSCGMVTMMLASLNSRRMRFLVDTVGETVGAHGENSEISQGLTATLGYRGRLKDQATREGTSTGFPGCWASLRLKAKLIMAAQNT